MKKITYNQAINFYALLPLGAENAIPLTVVKYRFKKVGRICRAIMEQMNEEQLPVINLMNGEGYFRPRTLSELTAYRKIINSYKCAYERKEYYLDKLVSAWGVLELDLPQKTTTTIENAS